MTNVKEKYEKWTEKVMSGDHRYYMITRSNDNRWYFVSGNHAEPILSLRIATDEGKGFCMKYESLVNHTEREIFNSTIIVKDDNKMIVHIGNEEQAFGLKDVYCPVKAIVIHCKMAYLHAFIFGSQASCALNTVLASVSDSEDAIEDCMSEFYYALKSVRPVEHENEEVSDA